MPYRLLEADDTHSFGDPDSPNMLIQGDITREKIAVVTGEQKDLDKHNLFSTDCPIDFVLTVEALKEGWDCSFAYIFCSVATVNSAKDVEQMLGRVLRMPYAERVGVDARARSASANFRLSRINARITLVTAPGPNTPAA